MPTITIPPHSSTLFLQAIPSMNLYIQDSIQISTFYHYLKISQSFTNGAQNHTHPISHRDASTLYYINNTIGHMDAAEWEHLLLTSMANSTSSLNTALPFLQAAYMMEPHKDNFWSYHNHLWKSLIWNAYRDILFHDPLSPNSLIYSNSYPISNPIDSTDPFLPFHQYLELGIIPIINYDV
jgi:hypothetical protein